MIWSSKSAGTDRNRQMGIERLAWDCLPVECYLHDVCSRFVWRETGDESLLAQCSHRRCYPTAVHQNLQVARAGLRSIDCNQMKRTMQRFSGIGSLGKSIEIERQSVTLTFEFNGSAKYTVGYVLYANGLSAAYVTVDRTKA